MIRLRKPLTQVDDSAEYSLLTRTQDADGNEYIYLKGVASTAANLAVTYDESGQTALLAANAVGPVAVAMAAIVANKYGWYQIFGSGTVSTAGAVADNAALYATGTAGKVDDAVVTGDCIAGMIARSAAAAAGDITVQLSYPVATDKLG